MAECIHRTFTSGTFTATAAHSLVPCVYCEIAQLRTRLSEVSAARDEACDIAARNIGEPRFYKKAASFFNIEMRNTEEAQRDHDRIAELRQAGRAK